MEVTMMLCDHAVVAEGKLYIHGGGWDQISARGPSTSVALLVQVPWDEMNRKQIISLRLVDEDGAFVTQQATGDAPVGIDAELEVGRSTGLRPGSSAGIPLAFTFPPLTLDPDRGYQWRVECDGEPIGAARFRTRQD